MNGYYGPQEVLVMEAELARAKAYLARDGVPADLLEFNAGLLAELVIKARSEGQRERDVASVAALRFRHVMLGIEKSGSKETVKSTNGAARAASPR